MIDILKESHNRLNDRFGQSMILLWYNNVINNNPSQAEIGTGFLVHFKNRKYIFSCHHVINEFMNAPHKSIKFQYETNKIFDLNNIIDWNTDETNDVGYLELSKECNVSKLIMMNEDDFYLNEIDWEANAFFIYGYPVRLGKFSDSYINQSFQPFSFLTLHSVTNPILNHYAFEYPSDESSEIEGSDSIPKPHGISGAPVIMFNITPNQLIDYTKAKLIGIEYSWIRSNRIFIASPISNLLSLIKTE